MKKSPRSSEKKVPRITDPRLAALLGYLENYQPEGLDRVADHARRAMAHEHASTPMHDKSFPGRLSWHELIMREQAGRSDSEIRLIETMTHATHETLEVRRDDLFNVVVGCISDAALFGAVVMYDLLQGREVAR